MPWTVRIENLADHAKPLGEWINRMLREWSPWHLKYLHERTLRSMEDRLWRTQRSLDEAHSNIDSLKPYIKALNGHPEWESDVIREAYAVCFNTRRAVSYEARVTVVDLLSRKLSLALAWPPEKFASWSNTVLAEDAAEELAPCRDPTLAQGHPRRIQEGRRMNRLIHYALFVGAFIMLGMVLASW